MNTILLTDLMTGVLNKGPDYVFVAAVFAMVFIIWRHYKKHEDFPEKFTRVEANMDHLAEQSREFKIELRESREEMRTEFKEFREEMRAEFKEDREEMRAEFKEFREGMRAEFNEFKEEMRAEFKEDREEMRAEFKGFREEMRAEFKEMNERSDKRFNGIENQLHEIKGELKLLNHKYDNHEARITKLESPDDKTLKSNQA